MVGLKLLVSHFLSACLFSQGNISKRTKYVYASQMSANCPLIGQCASLCAEVLLLVVINQVVCRQQLHKLFVAFFLAVVIIIDQFKHAPTCPR